MSALKLTYRPRVYFTFRNGQPRIVIDRLPYDPRTIDAGRMAEFIEHASRASLLRYCQWNDRNGCFTDAQVRLEFGRAGWTVEEFREIVRGMSEGK